MNRPPTPLTLTACFPGLCALAWSGHHLYASRGYDVLRAHVEDAHDITWQPVAHFRTSLRRRLSATNRLTARLFRDGFHALAFLPSAAIVGAVPSSIVTLGAGESEFRQTHAITRGTRPLHITATPGGAAFWGEYFDSAQRDEVHIYGSQDAGATWSIAYTFPKGTIRQVHNIVHDPWGNCLWLLTGDCGDECGILRTSCDFSRVEIVMQGNQQGSSGGRSSHRGRSLVFFRYAVRIEPYLSTGPPGRALATSPDQQFLYQRMPRRPPCLLLNIG